MHKGLGGRAPTQVWRRLGPQVLELFRRGVAAEYLVAVRVASEARYNVAGSLCLRNPELGACPEVRRRVGRLLLGVEDAAIMEGEVLTVSQGKPEEQPLHGTQLAVHSQVDAFDG